MLKSVEQIKWARVDSFKANSSSPRLTSWRDCPICGGPNSSAVLTIDGFQFFTDSAEVPKRVDLREAQCPACFALYLNPVYSDEGFRVLFAEAGQSYGATEGRPDEQLQWLSARGLLQAGARVLDVGCYDGGFLFRLPAHVKKVGVDIDAPAVERGRRQHSAQGLEFVHGDFENFHYAQPVDTITMFHVLEHLPRPAAVLRKLRSMARPETRLVVEVPILENGATNDINGFFSVQHMTHFSRRSLQNCFSRSGWRIIESCEAPDYNGCRVLAEPSESAVAVEGNPKDVLSLHKYLSGWHRAVADVEAALSPIETRGRVVIWGGGLHTEFLHQLTSLFRSRPSREYVIVDSDPLKQGKTWRGIPILAPSTLQDIDASDIPVVISNYGDQDIIANTARSLGMPDSSLVKLYDHCKVY